MTKSEKANQEPEKFDLRSHDTASEKIAELLRLFPEIRTEGGKLDFDRLKLALGESVDVGRERYGMNWPGKADCFKTIQAPSMGTLRPCREESVNFDTTENMIIEGDNLEVLKLLQKSYLGKVKMIYIDPPYNTGNDFIYPDNYSESLQTYLEYTGQVDDEGRKFGSNTEADGRFHSKWMNMMYPRLYLARNLLRPDGVMFISIDEHEIENLRRICIDIFGEESVLGVIVWKRRQVSDNRNLNNFSIDHEYVLAVLNGESQLNGDSKDLTKYSNPDNDPRGEWMSDNLTGLANATERPNLHYDLIHPVTRHVYPPLASRGWAYEKSRMAQLIADGQILWPSKPDGRPRLKRFLADIKSHYTGFSSVQEPGFTTDGTRELEILFGEKILGFPKPVSLITMLLHQATSRESSDIIIDFFAGSGTTAQSVFEKNKLDGGNRRFVLVQLPEPVSRSDFPTIADITKERVRRVIKKIETERAEELEGKKGKFDFEAMDSKGCSDHSSLDLGFRVFKLDESNFNTWNANVARESQAVERQLDLHIDHIRDGRSPEDILYELLLKSGFPLTTPVEEKKIEGKSVYSIASGALMICLEGELTLKLIRAIADLTPERVVFLDEGFAGKDQLKANAVQTFKTKGVASFRTV